MNEVLYAHKTTKMTVKMRLERHVKKINIRLQSVSYWFSIPSKRVTKTAKKYTKKLYVVSKKYIPLHSLNWGNKFGEVVEWSITAVLKTVELRGSGGSNPSLSAIKGVNQVVTRFTPFFTPKNQYWVYFFWIFKINAGEKRRMSIFFFSLASSLSAV